MFIFWMVLIAIVSVVWAVVSFIKEKNKKELEVASEEMTKGRVIFHSSSVADSSSSS